MFYAITVVALGALFYTGYLLPALALAFLIVVHESGHFFVARWCGMRVERFSLGFGPAIPGFKWRSKKGTTFQLAPLPFGGFVEIRGMNILEEVDPEDKEAYPNRPTWQRFVTIFAGPATNYLSAIVLAFGLYTCHGVNTAERYYTVDDVKAQFDAAGKLRVGDRIVTVDGKRIYTNRRPNLTERVTAKQGKPVSLVVVRADGTMRTEVITPTLDKDEEGKPKYVLGILFREVSDTVSIGIFDAAYRALVYPVEETKRIGDALFKIAKREMDADPGGPGRIMQEFKKAADYGPEYFIQLLMMLSVYLGLFNLLPLPALDGGRLVFLTYELITRRRANAKIEATVHMAGIMILFVVMIAVTLRDCKVI